MDSWKHVDLSSILLKCLDTNRDIHLALAQIHLMPTGAGLLSLAIMLFNRLIRGLLPQMRRDSINVDNDDLHHEALEAGQRKNDKGKDTKKYPIVCLTRPMVAVQQQGRGLWPHAVIVETNNDEHKRHSYTI